MIMRCRAGSVAVILLLLLSSTARSGTIRTIDGKTYEGEIRLENGQVVVTPKRAAAVKVELSDLLHGNFKNVDMPRPGPPANGGALDRAWKMRDIGPTGTLGSARLIDGKFSVKGAGSNIKGSADSFYFVYQEFHGDCQIIARLSDLQIVNPYEKAGLMIRAPGEDRDRGSKTAFLFLTPQDGSSFAWRAEQDGEMTATPLSSGDKPPVWLRLTRVRGTITAYKSIDGMSWVPVGQPQEISMGPRAFIGLAVCSRDANAACTATFEAVAIQQGTPRDEPPPKWNEAPGAAPAPMLNRAVVLRSGSVIGNVHIQSADAKSIEFTRADHKKVTLATPEVARLVLAPATPQQLAKIPPSGSGVLLAKGDFIEGELESLQNGRVKISSVVFGPRELAAGTEALVIVLRGIGTSASAWVVKTNEGFVYNARSARIEKDQLVIEDETTGSVKLARWNISEIKAGSGRFDSLCDAKPTKVERTDGVELANAYSIKQPADAPVSIAGQQYERGIFCQAGTSLTYELDGRYKMFVCRAGVADRVLPSIAVRMVVIADGKQLYQSEPRTSLDDAANVSLNVSGIHTLMLRVESAGNVMLPAAAFWGDPLLVK